MSEDFEESIVNKRLKELSIGMNRMRVLAEKVGDSRYTRSTVANDLRTTVDGMLVSFHEFNLAVAGSLAGATFQIEENYNTLWLEWQEERQNLLEEIARLKGLPPPERLTPAQLEDKRYEERGF